MDTSDEIFSLQKQARRLDAELYRGAFDASPALTFLTDSRAEILDANEAAAVFLNMERQALRMKPLLNFVARGDTREFRQRSRSIGTSEIAFIARLRPRHGTPCAMLMTAAPMPSRHAVVWIAVPAHRRLLPTVSAQTVLEGEEAPTPAPPAESLIRR